MERGIEREKIGCNEDKKAEHLKIIRAYFILFGTSDFENTDEMDNSLGKMLNKLDSSREGKLKPISVLKIEEVINYCAIRVSGPKRQYNLF